MSGVNNSIANRAQCPTPGEIVIGYDEWDKIWCKVQYRDDSNRFFEYPYTGAVYSLDRMNKWEAIRSEKGEAETINN